MSFTRNFFLILAVSSTQLYPQNRNTYLEQGEKAFARGAYDTAFELFQQAIETGENSGRPQFFMGQILESRKKYRESLTYFAQAIERPLEKNFKTAALWKLVLIHQQFQEYEACLRYIDRLEALGVRHENLTKIRIQAEALISPEKREARRRAGEALKREAELRPLRKDSGFYTQYHDELLGIATTLEEAANIDANLRPYLWNAAFYYEKLGKLDSARRVYLTLAEDESNKEKEKAWYKLGVLEKRNGEFEKSLEYFNKAFELKSQLSAAMRYYLRINAAQANFALGKYERALNHAEAAGTFSDGQGKIRMPELLRCLSLKKLGRSEPRCQELLREKVSSFRTGEKELFHIMAATEARKKGNHSDALRHMQAAFLSDKEAGNFINDEEEESGVPGWLLDEAIPAFAYFEEQKSSAFVLQMALRYPYLFGEPQYHRIVGEAAYKEKNYKTAWERLRQVENPTPEISDMLRRSLLFLKKYTELAAVLEQQAAAGPEEKEKVLQEIRQLHYTEFLKSIPGAELLRRLQSPTSQETNKPD